MAGKALLGGGTSGRTPSAQPKQTKISSSIFKAKPKLGKSTVSSSIFSGSSATIKVPKGMGYSNLGSKVDPKYLPKKAGELESTLVETNTILVDIQNQLAADFAYRIASEKQIEKKIRADTEKKRRSRREALLEGDGKIGRATSSVISKVTAPAISFLDNVFGFIGSVFEGFLASKALKWLSEKENQQKVENVFKFIQKNWKILLGIAGGLIGGVVVAKVISKLYRMYRITRGLLRLVGIGRGGNRGGSSGDTIQDGGKPRRGGLFRNAAGQRRGFNTVKTGNLQQMKDKFGRNKGLTEVYKTTKNPLSKFVQRLQVVGGRGASNIFRKIGLKGAVKFLRPLLKRIPVVGVLLDFGISLLLGEPIGRAAAKSVGALIGGIFGSVLGPFGSVGGAILGDMAGAGIYDFFSGMGGAEGMNKGGTVPGGAEGMNKGGTVPGGAEGMNKGGTVPGGGPNKDSVFAFLTPGEGVVPRDMMNDDMFGPFVKDIIYNGGSLYDAMVFALRKLEFSSDEFLKVNKQFGEILYDYTNTLKDSSQSIKPSPSIKPTPPPKPPISSPPKRTTGGLTPDTRNGEGSMGQIVLPPLNIGDTTQQSSKNIPVDNSFAKYGPIDISNPYLAYVKREFGILGG